MINTYNNFKLSEAVKRRKKLFREHLEEMSKKYGISKDDVNETMQRVKSWVDVSIAYEKQKDEISDLVDANV